MLTVDYLTLTRQSYGEDKGHYTGRLNIVGQAGDVSLKLSPALGDKIAALVGEFVVEAAKEVSNALSQEAFVVAQVEHQP